MDEPLAYVNGRFLPASQAALSLTDAGFVQGAAVAEQLRTFAGRIFRLKEHIERLGHSLDIIGVDPGIGSDRLAEIAGELVAHNHGLLDADDDLGLSIVVTPGQYPAYSPPVPISPTLCLHTYPLPFRLWAGKYAGGQALVVSDFRQVPPDSWPAELKCRSRMHYYLADRQAARVDPGARALVVDGQGYVTEASTANVLIFNRREGLVGPPRSKVLPGISLAEVRRLAEEIGIRTSERDLMPQDVAEADEVLLSSTPLCLLPVTRLDGRAIGDGRPGATFHRLMAAWSDRVGVDIIAQARRFAGRS